ncbi:hypothetical protein Q0M94_02340 [Deinococcus radiomollis]|uniref:hypothetical protein n=1 Tax=Deinococcus radiomollis TaxID=468916 RepID=UPI003891448B
MSRILLTDAEQLRSKIEGVGFQVAAVLAGPNGGVVLELKHPVTEAQEVLILTPEQAEVMVEQVTATLRCNAWRAGHTCQIAKPLHLMTRADEAHEAFGRR